jgi:hypothetical protein
MKLNELRFSVSSDAELSDEQLDKLCEQIAEVMEDAADHIKSELKSGRFAKFNLSFDIDY